MLLVRLGEVRLHVRIMVLNTSCVPVLVAGIELEVIDGCAVNNGDCQHKCKYKHGKVHCSCRKGYSLQVSFPSNDCFGLPIISLRTKFEGGIACT